MKDDLIRFEKAVYPEKDAIHRALTHGVPNLTDAQCLWLWEQAFVNEPIHRRRRCYDCNGEGVYDAIYWLEDHPLAHKIGGAIITRRCRSCLGTGYLGEQPGPDCEACQGTGARNPDFRYECADVCERCNGTGIQKEQHQQC